MTKEELKQHLFEHYHHSAERIFKNKFPEEYTIIISIKFPQSFNFQQKLYHYMHDDINLNIGLCPVCGNRCSFMTYKQGYKNHCSCKCSANDIVVNQKKIETTRLHFGVDNPSQAECVRQKKIETTKLHFGVDNPSQAECVKQKKIETTRLHFGVDNPSQAECVKEKKKKTCLLHYNVEYSFQSEIVREKSKQTNNKNLGVDWPMQSDVVLEKARQTNFKKSGYDWPMQNGKTKEKSKQTCFEKYETEYSWQADIVKEKIRQTNLSRHGVEWYCMHKNARKHSNDSKPNRSFAQKLDEHNISYEREFPLKSYSYDFKVNDILIEINPTITHNSALDIFGNNPKDENYHYNKMMCALNYGYKFIAIWDWDDADKIINCLLPKKQISNYSIKEINLETAIYFAELYSLNCPKFAALNYGLFIEDNLVQTMSLLENQNNTYSVSNIATHPSYECSNILIDWFIENKYPNKLFFEIDNSKYIHNISKYFKLYQIKNPEIHYFNIKTNKLSNNFDKDALLVFDCGYSLYMYDINHTDVL